MCSEVSRSVVGAVCWGRAGKLRPCLQNKLVSRQNPIALLTNAISAVFITVIKLVKNKPLKHTPVTLLVWYSERKQMYFWSFGSKEILPCGHRQFMTPWFSVPNLSLHSGFQWRLPGKAGIALASLAALTAPVKKPFLLPWVPVQLYQLNVLLVVELILLQAAKWVPLVQMILSYWYNYI